MIPTLFLNLIFTAYEMVVDEEFPKVQVFEGVGKRIGIFSKNKMHSTFLRQLLNFQVHEVLLGVPCTIHINFIRTRFLQNMDE